MAKPSFLRKGTPVPAPTELPCGQCRRSQRQTGLHRAPRLPSGAASTAPTRRLSAPFPPYPSWRTRQAPGAVQTRARRSGALRTGSTHRCKMADAAPPRAALVGGRGPPLPAASARLAPAPGRGTALPSGRGGAGCEARRAGRKGGGEGRR